MRPVAITGLGVVSALGLGRDDFARGMSADSLDPFTAEPGSFKPPSPDPSLRVAELRDFDPRPIIGDKGLRNNDRLTKLMLVAARYALEGAGLKGGGQWLARSPDATGVVGSTAYGSIEAIAELDRVATLEDPRYLNPARFPNTVINSALGYVSIWEDLRALNVTVTNGTTGGLDAFECAREYLSGGRCDAVLTGGGEAMCEGLWQAFRRVGALDTLPSTWGPGLHDSTGMRLGEGSAFAVLERPDEAAARGASVRALVSGYSTAFEPSAPDGALVDFSAPAMERAARGALDDAGLGAGDVDLVVTGLSGYAPSDAAELRGLRAAIGEGAPVAAPKARLGECLGASGSMALAAAVGWLEGAPLKTVLSGSPRRPRRVLLTALGFYGSASALVLSAPEGAEMKR